MVSILALIYVVFISLGLPDSIFGAAWPVIHTELGIDQSFASVFNIITGVCSGGASFVAGIVLRKFGTARVTVVSVLLTALGLLGMSFSPNIWIMMFFAVVLGYGAGAIDTGLNNYVSLHYKARHMSWLHCFWGIGVTLSPMIMSFFLKGENPNWRNGYRVVALLQLLIAAAVGVMLPKWINRDKENNEEVAAGNKENQKLRLSMFKGIFFSIGSLGFYCVMEFIIGLWGATYAVEQFGVGADIASRFVSVYYGGIMLGRLVNGFTADKIGDGKTVRLSCLFAFFGIIILLLPIGSFALYGLFLIGFGFGPIFPTVLHSVPERFGKEFSADLTGFHMGGAYAIGFASQLVFGFVASSTTFAIMPYVLIVSLVMTIVLHETAVKKTAKGNK